MADCCTSCARTAIQAGSCRSIRAIKRSPDCDATHSIDAVGEPVDLALVAIPAAGVAPALEDCARAGVKNTLIISSGFAEEGGAARDMQAALVEVTQRTGIRACGPNCEGYFNALGRIATTFSPTVEIKEDESQVLVSQRRVGVIAQSGGIGFALFNRGKAAGSAFPM